MSAQQWIHCNLCNAQMANKDTKFYHLSCLDVLCRTCMGKTNRGTTCPVCNNSLRHFTELGSAMGRKEKMLYHSFPVGLYQMSYQTLLFQHKQRKRLVESILKTRESLKRLDELESEIKSQVAQTQRKYENLRNHRRSLQENMRQTVSSGGGESSNAPVSSVCSQTLGTIPQRRMSTLTPSVCPPNVNSCPPERRYSVDSFNLANSVKMSQAKSTNSTFNVSNITKMSQASSQNDSGISMSTMSSTFGSGGSSFSAKNTPATMVSPIRAHRIPARRMSVAAGVVQNSATPLPPQRRNSTATFKQILGVRSPQDNSSSSTGDTR
ncbi:RING finger protein vilya [Anopheles gambiae]|uniref:RING finger protein vilya n=1 Tax=Anopheles gambiae TaxID=7165 RepID=UPI002AC9677A|nr:RING finger protein vilya [Anopheles gambiae]